MFSVRWSNLCAFMNTIIMYTDCTHIYMYVFLVCTKKQRTRSARKRTFGYMKKSICKFSILKALLFNICALKKLISWPFTNYAVHGHTQFFVHI